MKNTNFGEQYIEIGLLFIFNISNTPLKVGTAINSPPGFKQGMAKEITK